MAQAQLGLPHCIQRSTKLPSQRKPISRRLVLSRHIPAGSDAGALVVVDPLIFS
jgi:hypothetical protein